MSNVLSFPVWISLEALAILYHRKVNVKSIIQFITCCEQDMRQHIFSARPPPVPSSQDKKFHVDTSNFEHIFQRHHVTRHWIWLIFYRKLVGWECQKPCEAQVWKDLIFKRAISAWNEIQGDSKRCVPIFCSIKNPFFNECLFCCRTW